MPTLELYQQVRQGDAKAFEELFKQLYPSLCVLARNYVNDDVVAEDLAQEAFIKLWKERERYDEIGSLKSFLYVMVKNLCLNHIRHNRVKDEYSKQLDKDELFNFNNLVIEEETYRILQQAIDALPFQTSKIMRYTLQGMQNQEIAKRLDISVNTVKTLKYKALKKLKGTLKDYFYLLVLLR